MTRLTIKVSLSAWIVPITARAFLEGKGVERLLCQNVKEKE